jgi:hypothetical protein
MKRDGGRYVTVQVEVDTEVWVSDAEWDAAKPEVAAAPDGLLGLLASVTERLHEVEHDRMPWTVCSQEPCVTADHAVNGARRTGWGRVA